MSAICFVFLGWGVYLFSKEFFRDDRQGLYTLICILFLWGRGWDGANGFMFSSLVFNAYYPSVVSFIGIFFGLTILLKHIRRQDWKSFIGFVALSCLIALNHPVTGAFFFMLAALLIATEGYQSKKNFYMFAAALVAAFFTSVLWPYHDFIKSAFFILKGQGNQFWEYNQAHYWLYSQQLSRAGPAFLGLIPLAYFAVKNRHRFLVAGFTAFFILYAAGYIFHIILLERCIFYCMLFLQLAFSRLLKNVIEPAETPVHLTLWKGIRIVFVTGLCAGFFIQLYMTGKVYLPQWVAFTPQFRLKSYEHPLKKYIDLKPYLGRGDIVLADIFTSWVLPCTTDVKVVPLLHNIPCFFENIERVHDTMQFFISPGDRDGILKKYRVTHVLINKKKIPDEKTPSDIPYRFIPRPEEGLLSSLAGMGTVVLDDENFLLVEVEGAPRPQQPADKTLYGKTPRPSVPLER